MFNQRTGGQNDTPFTTVTLQVLNGCGVNGASEKMSRALLPGDGDLVYDIIERDNAELTAFEETLIVDRRGSGNGEVSEQARKIAERLDIDDDDIVLQKFDDNILEIDVTIIVGVDYQQYIDKLNNEREALL